MKTINTFLPIFPGFYGSHFAYDNEEVDIENYNEDNGTDLNYDAFTFNYVEYNKRVSEKCVEVVERELQYHFNSIKIEFKELISPREYNFRNDIINVDIQVSEKDFEEIIMYIGLTWSSEFKGYLKDNFTSGPGFISFVENDSETWLNEYLKEDSKYFENCFGHVLDFILLNEDFTMDELLEAVSDENYIEFNLD